ncbi:MAG: hypothetical protein P8L85_09620 [Rubripirellula sp.]|nr:hypothetical protein [Rubripirellula sp.]
MGPARISLEKLFDAEEYFRLGECPWTFFAYPTSLAGDFGLPVDDDACRLLAEVQGRGIEVAVWRSEIVSNTTFYVCRRESVSDLKQVIQQLEVPGKFGARFCELRSEALFARLRDASSSVDEMD